MLFKLYEFEAMIHNRVGWDGLLNLQGIALGVHGSAGGLRYPLVVNVDDARSFELFIHGYDSDGSCCATRDDEYLVKLSYTDSDEVLFGIMTDDYVRAIERATCRNESLSVDEYFELAEVDALCETFTNFVKQQLSRRYQ